MSHADTRYLESKRSVDGRALARRVTERLRATLPSEPRVLDVGCGTGAMLARLREWGVRAGRYRGIDRDSNVVAFAREVRPAELRYRGADVRETDSGFAVDELAVTFETDDALDVLANGDTDADLVIAAAFADLVSLPSLIDGLECALRPGGLAYLPITFDAGSLFQPDHPADERVERAYHRALDDRPGRDVRAGRHLADLFRRRTGTLVSMAASDWVVRPREGGYPADESYFLSCILDFVEHALDGRGVEGVDDWLATRRRQVECGDLIYVAHQYDLLYRAPESTTRGGEPEP